jgi:UDP-glucose 4-epimerase
MTILILGGCGFLGRNLTDFLVDKGFNLRVVCKTVQNKIDNNVEYVTGDVTETDSILNVFDKDVEVIVDLAGSVGGVKGSSSYLASIESYIKLNVYSKVRLIQYAEKFESRIIFASSEEVYGLNPQVPWKENSLNIFGESGNPRSIFGLCKLLTEHFLLSASENGTLKSTILRLSNVYGKYQKPYLVIPRMISSALLKSEVIVYGSGKQKRSFLYVDDAIDAIYRIIEKGNNANGIFNVGSKEEITIEELAHRIISIAGLSKSSIKQLNISNATNMKNFKDLDRKVLDTAKIHKVVGWVPKTDLSKGLNETFDWYNSHRDWWNTYVT